MSECCGVEWFEFVDGAADDEFVDGGAVGGWWCWWCRNWESDAFAYWDVADSESGGFQYAGAFVTLTAFDADLSRRPFPRFLDIDLKLLDSRQRCNIVFFYFSTSHSKSSVDVQSLIADDTAVFVRDGHGVGLSYSYSYVDGTERG